MKCLNSQKYKYVGVLLGKYHAFKVLPHDDELILLESARVIHPSGSSEYYYPVTQTLAEGTDSLCVNCG
jgi:hypothetical protein